MSCFLLKKSDQKTLLFFCVLCVVVYWFVFEKTTCLRRCQKQNIRSESFWRGGIFEENLLLCIPLILLMQFSQGYPQSLKCKTCSFYQSIPYRKFPLVLGSSFIDVVFFLRVFMGTWKARCLLSNNFSLVTWTLVYA